MLLGNGDGTFRAKVDYRTGTDPQCLRISDLDADGVYDIVTANAGLDPGERADWQG